MYIALLVLHSALRWLVLIALVGRIGLAAHGLATRRPWEKPDRIGNGVTLGTLHSALLLGVLVYALSPLVRVAMSDMGSAMKDPALRFYAVEHGPTMLLAGVAATVGVVAARRATEDRARHVRTLIGFAAALLAIVASIPWPFRELVGRPLLLVP